LRQYLDLLVLIRTTGIRKQDLSRRSVAEKANPALDLPNLKAP
jgi:hypothetical protein